MSSSLGSAAAAFEADEFATLPRDEQMRRLYTDIRRLRNLCAENASALRTIRRRVERLEKPGQQLSPMSRTDAERHNDREN